MNKAPPINTDGAVAREEARLAESGDKEIAPDLDVCVALQKLPDSQRQAAWLHWVERIPVESNDTTQQTVSTLIRKSGRMVRKYLRAARATLKTEPSVIELVRERSTAEGADSSGLSCTGLALHR